MPTPTKHTAPFEAQPSQPSSTPTKSHPVNEAITDALIYLLDAVGDHQVEGQANTLRHALIKAAGRTLNENDPAPVSDIRGTKADRVQAAKSAADLANAALADAEAATA